MYANVGLSQCSRICNDTSVSCSNYKGKAQLAEDGCCITMYLGKAMEMP